MNEVPATSLMRTPSHTRGLAAGVLLLVVCSLCNRVVYCLSWSVIFLMSSIWQARNIKVMALCVVTIAVLLEDPT